MSPEDISECFVESHHCKTLIFDNFGVLSENGESRLILFVNIVYDVYLGKMYCQENSV